MAPPGRFTGRFWHALKRDAGQEVTGLIAQFLAGPGITKHWDFLTTTPLRDVLPELAALGVPEDEWPDDDTDDRGNEFLPNTFNDGYGQCRSGCDTSSESDGESFYTGPRAPNRHRLAARRYLHDGWRFGFRPHPCFPALLDGPAGHARPAC